MTAGVKHVSERQDSSCNGQRTRPGSRNRIATRKRWRVRSVWDINREGVEETDEMIRKSTGRAIAFIANAASAADIAAAAARTRAVLGPIMA